MKELQGSADINYFLNVYRGICDFSVDQSYKERENLFLPRPSHINYSEFFDNLYVEREQERDIIEALYLFSDMILLVGEKGSGKTSLIHKIARDLLKQNDFLFFIINARTADELSRPLDQVPPDEISRELMDALKRKYMDKVFTDQVGGDGAMPAQKLAAYIISREEKPAGYEFGKLVHPMRRKFRRYANRHQEDVGINENMENVLKWLVKVWDIDDEVYDYVYNELFKAPPFKTSFLMHAAHSILGFKRQCIWVDNVDALSPRQQSRVQSALRRLASSVSEFANIGVSVRSENIVIEDEFDENQAPPRFLKVRLYLDEKSDPKHRETRAVPMSRVSWEDFEAIVHRRLQFAARQAKIKPIEFEKIKRYSEKILSVFKRIHCVDLSNSSIRYMLRQHWGFLSSLVDLNYKPNNLDERAILTLYLAWIRANPVTKHQFSLLDWIANVSNSGEMEYFCALVRKGEDEQAKHHLLEKFLPHLLLTGIWNLTLLHKVSNKHTFNRPRIGEVRNAMVQRLGISENKFKEIMFSLYQNVADEDTPRLIHIQNPLFLTLINSPDSIKEEFIVSLTSRAKSILQYVLNTYGFIASSKQIATLNSFEFESMGMEKLIISSFQEEEAWKFIREEILALGGIALCHLSYMQEFYRQKRWFERYLEEFGILIPRHWRANLGYNVRGERRAVQYEIMLSGVGNFFGKNRVITEEITDIHQQFRQELDKVISGDLECKDVLEHKLFSFQAKT